MLTFFLFGTTVFFGLVAIFLSVKEERTKKVLKEREALQKRRVYEISTLKAIQDRIGYSLDIEKVIDTLSGSLKNLFPYSTASSLLLKQDKLVLKTTIDERVSSSFIEQVKKSMLASLSTLLDTSIPTHIEETKTGLVVDETNTKMMASFFNIPLVVSGEVIGLITIASTQPSLYVEEDMTILYQMTSQAASALSKLKEVIRYEESKLLAMITSLTDGVLMIDTTFTISIINTAAKKFLNIEHIENPSIFDVVSPLSRKYDFGAKIKEAMVKNTVITEQELALLDKIVAVVITPVVSATNGQSHIIGATILIHDITLEKSLAKLKEDFTNTVVHELRSPLTAIKAAAELMEWAHNLDENQKKLINIIDEQSKRMLADITSLLDAAKLESGHFTVWQAANDIKKIIQDSIDLFLPEAEKKHIALLSDVTPNLPMGFVDPMRVSQILNNLLSNSLKFTNPGGRIDIKASMQHNEYLPHTLINPGILIAVTDNGIGIPKEKQGMLFNKFSQITQDTHTPVGHEGTGLGLYVSKGIVEAHGGTIFLNSTPGVGTTISFTLPIAQGVPALEVVQKPFIPVPISQSVH